MPHCDKPARERAARALCRLNNTLPDITFDDLPLWRSYLPEVDAVLLEVMGFDAWQAMVESEGHLAS